MKVQKKEIQPVKQPPKTVMTSNQKKIYNNLVYNSYPTGILTDNNLNTIDRELLSVIFTMINNTGQFFQSNGTLANELDVSKRTIISSMENLNKNKYITYDNFVKNGRLRRYITSINYSKLNMLNKRVLKQMKKTQLVIHKSTKKAHHQSKSKPLNKKQKHLINKAIKVISKYTPDYNAKHIRNTFISEYNNGRLNFSHMNTALIIYVYEKIVEQYPINSSAGFISSLTTKTYNQKQLKKIKSEISNMKDNNSRHQDDFNYDDADPIYNKISSSPKLSKQYQNKYGVNFECKSAKDISKLRKIFKINYYEDKNDFMEHIQNLIDTGKLGDIPANYIKGHYLFNQDKINQYLKNKQRR